MWIPLLALLLSRLTRAAQNYTIDDASPLITYDAPSLERNHTAFDSRLLWDGTITYVVPAPDFSPTISIPFSGTAIYIFVAYPGIAQPAPSGFNASIDGAPAGNWAAAESALLYRHLVWHTAALPDAPHTLLMQINPGWELYFDYAVYMSNIAPPVEPLPSSSGSTRPSSSSTLSTPPALNVSEPIVLTVDGKASTVDIGSTLTMTQPAEISTTTAVSILISTLAQTSSGGVVSAPLTSLPLNATSSTVERTSQQVDGTSQSADTAAATSSQITTIIRMAGSPSALPMIGAFLGGVLFATLVIAACLILIRRRRLRSRKRRPWTLNAARLESDQRAGTPDGDPDEKPKFATDFEGWMGF
ncbi:hypothetical protein B0H16DRAFT_1685387 [Mycena metata]|uniref:Mid2 domain-containing protein n=1 Tax=Mycena metata TaxID=1033252 RepID=A0AAD7JV32_9AGAR|nr:hypothetical protein B0H16DRAFT_1685387 [Mycena metata]